MIIGMNDRERVRKLEVECKLSRELIKHIEEDMREIAEFLRDKTDLDTTDIPLINLWDDIGRCVGHLDYYK